MCPNTHRTQSNLNQSIIKQKILWKIYWKKNASSRNYLNLSIPPLYFQIKIYDENWFVLSMVLRGDWRSGQNGQTLLCPVQGYSGASSQYQIAHGMLSGPSSHHRMGRSGHGWDDGDSDVSVIIVVVSGSEPGDLSERLLVNFPCLHSLDAAGHWSLHYGKLMVTRWPFLEEQFCIVHWERYQYEEPYISPLYWLRTALGAIGNNIKDL